MQLSKLGLTSVLLSAAGIAALVLAVTLRSGVAPKPAATRGPQITLDASPRASTAVAILGLVAMLTGAAIGIAGIRQSDGRDQLALAGLIANGMTFTPAFAILVSPTG